MSTALNKAIKFATDAHAGQVNHSGHPYILHPLAVMLSLFQKYGAQEEDILVTALLHDVVEDTHLTLDDIEDNFGERVRVAVDSVTRREEHDEPYAAYVLRARDNRIGRLVKLADLEYNLRLAQTHPLPEPKGSRLVSRYRNAQSLLGSVAS